MTKYQYDSSDPFMFAEHETLCGAERKPKHTKSRLYKFRKYLRFTQEEMAQAIGASRQSINDWENKNSYPYLKHYNTIKELARDHHFEISMYDIYPEGHKLRLALLKRQNQEKCPLCCTQEQFDRWKEYADKGDKFCDDCNKSWQIMKKLEGKCIDCK